MNTYQHTLYVLGLRPLQIKKHLIEEHGIVPKAVRKGYEREGWSAQHEEEHYEGISGFRAHKKSSHTRDNPQRTAPRWSAPNPRPPSEWWVKMRARMKVQYPRRSAKSLDTITAGIWWGYSPAVRERLIKRYG